MGIYMTMDYRKEAKRRIQYIDSIRENLRDAEAELEEVKKRDPLCQTKGSGDYQNRGNSGSDKTPPGVALPMREDKLEDRVKEYRAIVKDFDRGWNLLDDKQRTYLECRYKLNMSSEAAAHEIGYSIRQALRIEEDALRVLDNEILRM